MTTYELVAGDGGSKLHVTVLDSVTQAPIDLTGKTAKARYAINGGATVEKTLTVLNQTTNKGQAEYQFLTTDLTVGGVLDGEVRVQAGQSDQLTSVDEFHIAVRMPLPAVV
jgi:hypothetical protein